MERREFLKIAAGAAAGIVTFVASAQAAPLIPQSLNDDTKQPQNPLSRPYHRKKKSIVWSPRKCTADAVAIAAGAAAVT
jgi:hypothetical protein